jgi:hypothetical protein
MQMTANMKTFIYYGSIVLIVLILAYAGHLMEKRDRATAAYWEQRQSECRSLGFEFDLNNKGKCVRSEIN